MNKAVKVLTHSTLAVTLVMGNITPPSKQSYYEDDESFHQVSTEMQSGWGWKIGINKVQAFARFENCHGGTDCSTWSSGIDPDEDTTEHIPITGRRPPGDPWGGIEDSTDDGTVNGGTFGDSNDAGGGGGGSPEKPSPEQLEKERIKQCKADALKVNKDEHSNIEAVMQGTIFGCGFLKAKAAISACTGAAIWAATDAKGKSDIRYTDAVDACE
ncbi:hypothetical protein [Thalassomonas haliotis]|uniref:Uncharacterized protein n=1 Tax=Thalassomonas haliotis TaxID=485448 RepID=A0ABY7VCK8_9GAMM|nr:hypothetical protein [Thalassomonas haliotis]WDE11403.1 hypothetical protein H3N35_24820 [Thalassomonas haliotis]